MFHWFIRQYSSIRECNLQPCEFNLTSTQVQNVKAPRCEVMSDTLIRLANKKEYPILWYSLTKTTLHFHLFWATVYLLWFFLTNLELHSKDKQWLLQQCAHCRPWFLRRVKEKRVVNSSIQVLCPQYSTMCQFKYSSIVSTILARMILYGCLWVILRRVE